MVNDKLVYQQVLEEKGQRHSTRQRLYKQIGAQLGKPLIAYFTSFPFPSMINNSDADMLEGILQKIDTSKGFALLISSPGGDGLAAERIINICRTYAGDAGFDVIIPGKAKSAATIICLGATKLIMSETAELGPIDPQFVMVNEGGQPEVYSAYNLINSYKKIFEKAVNTSGNTDPYLQALSKYDPRQIEQLIYELELSKDIAVKALQTGMLKNSDEDTITKKIQIFLVPEETKVHARPIYYRDVMQCGFNVELYDPKSKLWSQIYELYLRLNSYVSTSCSCAKCIENGKYSFHAGACKDE